MRRKTRNMANSKTKAFIYTCSLVALTAYAIPRMPKLEHGLAGTFSFIWLLFVALAVAANVYFLFGADKERSRMLEARASNVVTLGEEASPRKARGL